MGWIQTDGEKLEELYESATCHVAARKKMLLLWQVAQVKTSQLSASFYIHSFLLVGSIHRLLPQFFKDHTMSFFQLLEAV